MGSHSIILLIAVSLVLAPFAHERYKCYPSSFMAFRHDLKNTVLMCDGC
jgi:hypothetical protein